MKKTRLENDGVPNIIRAITNDTRDLIFHDLEHDMAKKTKYKHFKQYNRYLMAWSLQDGHYWSNICGVPDAKLYVRIRQSNGNL